MNEYLLKIHRHFINDRRRERFKKRLQLGSIPFQNHAHESSRFLKGGYRKVYSSLDSLRRERENGIPDRNTMPKKVSILTKGSVSLDTMRAWKREMDYVYAGGEFA